MVAARGVRPAPGIIHGEAAVRNKGRADIGRSCRLLKSEIVRMAGPRARPRGQSSMTAASARRRSSWLKSSTCSAASVTP